MRNILIDTCFWYALYDKRDEHFDNAQEMKKYLEYGNILIPHPVLYETLNTRFAKRKEWVSDFNEYLKKKSTILIPDEKYRSIALASTLETSISGDNPRSLVDMTIRLMMDDITLDIGALITFNVKDFYDLCYPKGIELISKPSKP